MPVVCQLTQHCQPVIDELKYTQQRVKSHTDNLTACYYTRDGAHTTLSAQIYYLTAVIMRPGTIQCRGCHAFQAVHMPQKQYSLSPYTTLPAPQRHISKRLHSNGTSQVPCSSKPPQFFDQFVGHIVRSLAIKLPRRPAAQHKPEPTSLHKPWQQVPKCDTNLMPKPYNSLPGRLTGQARRDVRQHLAHGLPRAQRLRRPVRRQPRHCGQVPVPRQPRRPELLPRLLRGSQQNSAPSSSEQGRQAFQFRYDVVPAMH